MAKKTTRARKKTSAKRPAAKRARKQPAAGRARRAAAAVPAIGPVSLEEARALAIAKSPAAAAGLVTPTPSPAEVGREREKLEAEQDAERRRRIREYTATLEIMKRRGVKGLGAVAGVAPQPLQIFAEGDSWFDYPVPGFGGGIIKRLEKRIGVPVLNLAKAGDEVRFMLGVKERRIIAEQFTKGCPAGGPWEAMLFSGGGNDIVDNPMALWIRDYDASKTPAQQIHQPRLDAALAIVRAGYEDLIALRKELSPTTHLFFHAYDFAIPDGRKVCHLGPWLEPTFTLRKFPDLASRTEVTRVMLEQFAAMTQSLADANQQTVTFINTQGTLAPVKDSWHNELHPSKKGFDTFADLFRDKLKQVFPGRIL
jgi:hypothetical protein